MSDQLDIHELRKTATERRRRLDDIAADALTAACDEIERLRAQLAPTNRQFPIAPETIAANAPMSRVPTVLIERARWAMHNENLEMLDETIEEIIEAAGSPREDAEADTNALRARHHRLMLNFPDQGFDWRTPVTALVNEIPAMADEIDRLRAELAKKPRAITTAAELDALPVGAVIRGLGPYGGLWQVTDDEELKRYAGAGDDGFHMGETLLRQGGPLELLWSPEW
ncbi:hypothetical protein ACFVU2_19205 [Leifsonia sp. NPDC058194]|uniref:hypothetical protein n=1 Tax=Leifsonia sp. NPDC058194 TaxID=3346374 RepID=UPI0036D7FEC4